MYHGALAVAYAEPLEETEVLSGKEQLEELGGLLQIFGEDLARTGRQRIKTDEDMRRFGEQVTAHFTNGQDIHRRILALIEGCQPSAADGPRNPNPHS